MGLREILQAISEGLGEQQRGIGGHSYDNAPAPRGDGYGPESEKLYQDALQGRKDGTTAGLFGTPAGFPYPQDTRPDDLFGTNPEYRPGFPDLPSSLGPDAGAPYPSGGSNRDIFGYPPAYNESPHGLPGSINDSTWAGPPPHDRNDGALLGGQLAPQHDAQVAGPSASFTNDSAWLDPADPRNGRSDLFKRFYSLSQNELTDKYPDSKKVGPGTGGQHMSAPRGIGN